jgi:hypothetical protein
MKYGHEKLTCLEQTFTRSGRLNHKVDVQIAVANPIKFGPGQSPAQGIRMAFFTPLKPDSIVSKSMQTQIDKISSTFLLLVHAKATAYLTC